MCHSMPETSVSRNGSLSNSYDDAMPLNHKLIIANEYRHIYFNVERIVHVLLLETFIVHPIFIT